MKWPEWWIELLQQWVINQTMHNIYLQWNKMEWERQWMSLGFLLIKTTLQTEEGEGTMKRHNMKGGESVCVCVVKHLTVKYCYERQDL